MKRIKIVAIALFTLATIVNVNAQDSNNPWAVSVGINAVDTYDAGGETTSIWLRPSLPWRLESYPYDI